MNKLTKFSRAILAIAMMLMAALPSLAHDFEVDGVYYKIMNETEKRVTATYKGDYNDSYSNEYSGNVIIPSSVTYNGTIYSVTSIDDYAFYGCTGLTSVTIGNSVIEIGKGAFHFCTKLTSVTMGNSVTLIGEYAFKDCSNMIVISIPNSVTSIGSYAFCNCTSLTSINIPNSLTTIDDNVFRNCFGLTSITIPNSVLSIGSSAFYYCTGLTSVTIPNSVTSIGECAFAYCTRLMDVSIPNSVITIEAKAFNNCSNLTNITLPNSVKYLRSEAFSYCSNLTSVIISNSLTWIEDEVFSHCTQLAKVVIPDSTRLIKKSAFSYCTNLTSVTIGNSVTRIDEYAFDVCDNLNSIILPNSVKNIGNFVFNRCNNLKTIVLLSTKPPICSSSDTFNYTHYNYATLYVPKDSYAKYFVDEVWGQFKSIKKIETLMSSITLNKTVLTINPGNVFTLKATASPTNATIPTLTWESDNSAIAIVDQNGKVTGISAGTATITVKANDGSNVSASCKVTVNSVTPTITLSQTEATLPVNEIMTLSYSITNSATKTATWSTSNANVAYVKTNNDGSATIVGMADGVATITATMDDNGKEYSASCKVTVGVGGVEGVEVDNNAVEVARYDIHGRLLSEPTPGINIVKMSNGTTRKEIVK